MKKTLIALALVSLPVAASAEVILYGAIKAGVEYQSNATRTTGHIGKPKEKAFNIVDYGTRIGLKGSEDLGNGLKAIWQFETRASVGSGTYTGKGRDSFIGLEGGFGTVRAGYVSSPLKHAVDAQDNWEYSEGNEVLGLGRYTRFGERRTSINYTSPNLGGFELMAQYTPGNNARPSPNFNNDGQPVYGLGLSYSNSGFFGRYAVEYQDYNKGQKDTHIHNLSAGYDANNLYVALGLQYARNVAGLTKADVGADKTGEIQLSAAYTSGAVTPKLSAAYGRASDSGERYTQVVAGADYAFSRRTTGLVSLGWLRDKAASGQNSNSTWSVGTGIVHKF